MCQILGIKRNSYYSYQKRKNSKPENDPEHDEIIEMVTKIAKASDYTYGERRMKNALNALGFLSADI